MNCKESLINTFSNFKLLNKSISRHQKWITHGWGQLLKYLPHVIIPGVFQEISWISCSPGVVWGVNSNRGVSKSFQELFKRKKDSSVFIYSKTHLFIRDNHQLKWSIHQSVITIFRQKSVLSSSQSSKQPIRFLKISLTSKYYLPE